MKQEWYEYSLTVKRNTNNKIRKISGFGIYAILFFFSLPLLIRNVWLWLVLIALYICSLVVVYRENNDYAKALFDIGITMLVVGIEISTAVFILLGYYKLSFLVLIAVGFVFYEIMVLTKVKLKKYSDYSVKSFGKKKLLATNGVLSGMALGHFLISNDQINILMALALSISVALIVSSIAFLQMYIVYKITNKT